MKVIKYPARMRKGLIRRCRHPSKLKRNKFIIVRFGEIWLRYVIVSHHSHAHQACVFYVHTSGPVGKGRQQNVFQLQMQGAHAGYVLYRALKAIKKY